MLRSKRSDCDALAEKNHHESNLVVLTVVYIPPNKHKMKNKRMKNRCLMGRTRNISLDLRF